MADPGDFPGGLNLARDVAGMAQDHQRRARCDGGSHRFRQQNPPAVRRQDAHGDFTCIVVAHQGAHHRVMLRMAHQHLVPRPQRAADGHVQGVGAVQAEDHLFGRRQPAILRRQLPAAVHDAPARQRAPMPRPARIAADLFHHPSHGFDHRRRLGKAGGRVVQINQKYPSPRRTAAGQFS